MKRFAAFLLLATAALSAPAAKPEDDAIAGLANAVSRGVSGNAAEAAQAAGRDNDAKPGTLGWHQQSSLKLLQYAYLLRAQLRFDESKQAAAVAVSVLTDGLGKYGTGAAANERVEAYDQIGQVYEELLGDRANALRYFNAALTENPADEKARGALQRTREQADSLGRAAQQGGRP